MTNAPVVATETEKLKKKIRGPNGGSRPGAGRPKGSVSEAKKLELVTKAMIKEMALQHATKAINALVEIVEDGAHSQRVSASIALLDRGLGKPTQEVTGEDGGPVKQAIEITWASSSSSAQN
jgi:hypothetical protein